MSNLNILLVDDDRDLIDSLEDFLELKGHDVEIALTGEEGIAAARKKDYDAIILDILLPDINGVTALHYIKEVKPEVRIMLMTGFSSLHVEKEIIPGEPLPCMIKPLDLDALMEWLDAT